MMLYIGSPKYPLPALCLLPSRAGREYRERGPYGENRGFFRLSDDPQLTRGPLIPYLGTRHTCNRDFIVKSSEPIECLFTDKQKALSIQYKADIQ